MNIKYQRTWCEYLTPCPYKILETSDRYVMVGSWECSQCKYHINDDFKNNIVNCKKK